MFVFDNPNPDGIFVGDCVIRAVAIAEGKDWESAFIDLALQGLLLKDMPSSNRVWGTYLNSKGYERRSIISASSDCYTVKDFCDDYPRGVYVLGTGSHVVVVIDGDWHDTWDSGQECPAFYYEKEWR